MRLCQDRKEQASWPPHGPVFPDGLSNRTLKFLQNGFGYSSHPWSEGNTWYHLCSEQMLPHRKRSRQRSDQFAICESCSDFRFGITCLVSSWRLQVRAQDLNFMWNLVEPCGTSTFKNGTCMRNLAEPGPRFRAAAPNHPEALLEEPQAFQAVGELQQHEQQLPPFVSKGSA